MNDHLLVRACLDDGVAALLREPYIVSGSEQTIKCLEHHLENLRRLHDSMR